MRIRKSAESVIMANIGEKKRVIHRKIMIIPAIVKRNSKVIRRTLFSVTQGINLGRIMESGSMFMIGASHFYCHTQLL